MEKKTLKQHVIEYSEEEGYSCDTKEELYETFIECDLGVAAWVGKAQEHRWYTKFDVVYKVVIDMEERFFKHYFMKVSGDGDPADCGWKAPDLDELKEVYPHKVTAIVYKDEPQA